MQTVEYNLKGRSLVAWVGGKSKLAKRIVPLMPAHECYAEVFAGGAWLLFKKTPSKVEVINDLNKELVTLFRVVKHHPDEFVKCFRWLTNARDEFERFKLENPETLTDVHRAVRFYYLARTSYGAKVTSPTFGTSALAPPRLNLFRLEEELSAAHTRFYGVVIENLPYLDFIARYDRPGTLFYVDPPYYGCEDYYGPNMFERDDFTRLRDMLASIKGKFVMSINDVPEIRELFSRFNVQEVPTNYSLGADHKKPVCELVIMNY